ncbi:hypothetical protein CgunFtcFv8_015537 [Champsocephalus gunnari]|uniref:Uncharacterized protein n=1 Tax=Champsocephalus gunnari TaxID=52237 RepID=A0AAN8C6K0_CHAGU|nr:hypothetical protein CgunFtcFv8_015537 [Champsocephalus gunnari]
MAQTVDPLLVSLRNSWPLPTPGWGLEEVGQGPALPLPPGQGYVAEETHHKETAGMIEVLWDSVDPEMSLEEWFECTVQRWV